MKAQKPQTASQKLRSVLFLVWENNVNTGTFEAWYEEEMRQIIENQKRRIDQSPPPEPELDMPF